MSTMSVLIILISITAVVAFKPMAKPYNKMSHFQRRISSAVLDIESGDSGYDTIKELKAYIDADIYPGDNFWTGTRKRMQSERLKAALENNMDKRIELETRYQVLNEMSFERRVQAEADERQGIYKTEDTENIPFHYMLKHALQNTEISVQTDEMKQLLFEKMKREMVAKRRGVLNLLPKFTHRFIDYIASLKKPPSKKLLLRNVGFGIFFAALMIFNTGRRATTFAVAGNLIICSLLLSRGMPVKENNPGMDRRAVNWSTQSWMSAFAVTALFSAPTVLVTKFLLDLFLTSIASKLKWSVSFAAGMVVASLGTSFYEVFEPKTNGGWRWKNVESGYLPLKLEEKLRDQVFAEDSTAHPDMEEKYEFEYNPDIDDYDIVIDEGSKLAKDMNGVNIRTEVAHYENWVKERKEKQRSPPSFLPADDAAELLGTKNELLRDSVPKDIRKKYRDLTTKLNPWRKKKQQFKLKFSDDPIVGPYGFRDKTPHWINEFSSIFTDKVSQRQKLARSYGTYRKSMYKKDDKVVLLPTDGAKGKPPKMPVDKDDGGDGIDDFMNEQDDRM